MTKVGKVLESSRSSVVHGSLTSNKSSIERYGFRFSKGNNTRGITYKEPRFYFFDEESKTELMLIQFLVDEAYEKDSKSFSIKLVDSQGEDEFEFSGLGSLHRDWEYIGTKDRSNIKSSILKALSGQDSKYTLFTIDAQGLGKRKVTKHRQEGDYVVGSDNETISSEFIINSRVLNIKKFIEGFLKE